MTVPSLPSYNRTMSAARPSVGALVLYKQGPARIVENGEKRILIETQDQQRLRVRPKDILLLHPGPLQSMSDLLAAPDLFADLVAAWELLAGSETTLLDLVGLVTNDNTPAATWAVWQMVMDGLYFGGEPDRIIAAAPEAVQLEKDARLARQKEQEAWSAFVARANAGHLIDEDAAYVDEVVDLALGRQPHSQVLRALGKEQTPENAHDFLLQTGFWDYSVNPYPSRAGLPLTSASEVLPPLADEPRRDFTHLEALAIDDAGSHDPDDAISLEDGRFWVHVADAGALIHPGTYADLEARARGANLYLPEGTVTMLPPEATHQLGLGLAERSPALSIGFFVESDGRLSAVEIIPSRIAVTRWTYEEAETHLDEPLPGQLLQMAAAYYARRQRNGLIDINLPEVRVTVEGDRINIAPIRPLQSRNLVREAMLMAGEAVAQYAQENKIPIPFTIQEPPTSEMPSGDTPSTMFARRRLLRPSRQSTVVGPHSGLGMSQYAQVTSPLRRYLDLVIHQQLRAFLHGRPLLKEQAISERIAACELTRRDLRTAERLSREHWTLAYLLQQPHWQGEGIVVEQSGRRHRLLLPELALETDLYPRRDYPLDSVLRLGRQDVQLAYLAARFVELTPS